MVLPHLLCSSSAVPLLPQQGKLTLAEFSMDVQVVLLRACTFAVSLNFSHGWGGRSGVSVVYHWAGTLSVKRLPVARSPFPHLKQGL